MAILTKTLFAFVGSDLMTFTFLSARHTLLLLFCIFKKYGACLGSVEILKAYQSQNPIALPLFVLLVTSASLFPFGGFFSITQTFVSFGQ